MTLIQAAKNRYQTEHGDFNEQQLQTEVLPEYTKFIFGDFYNRYKTGDPVDTAIAGEFVDSFMRRYCNTRINHTKDVVFRSDLYYHLNKWERYIFGGTDEYDHLREAAVNMQATVTETNSGETSQTDSTENTEKTTREEISQETAKTTNQLNRDGTSKTSGSNTGTETTEGTSDENNSGVVETNTSSEASGDEDSNTTSQVKAKMNENSSSTTNTTDTSSSLQVGSDYPQSEAEIPDGAGDPFILKYASTASKGRDTKNGTSEQTGAHESSSTQDTTGAGHTTTTSNSKGTTKVSTTNDTTGSTSSTTTRDLQDESTTTDQQIETGTTDTTRSGSVNGQDTRTGTGSRTTTGTNNGSLDRTEDREAYTQLDRVLRILDYLHSHRYPPIYEVIEKLSVCFMAQMIDDEDEGYIDPSTDLLAKLKEA